MDIYEFQIKGHLDDRWSDWLGGLVMQRQENGTTVLVGPLVDQAALYGVVAVVIGGLGNILGAYFGGLLLGLAQHLGVWYISSKWQDAIAFAILILFLLFRPQGFFGRSKGQVASGK